MTEHISPTTVDLAEYVAVIRRRAKLLGAVVVACVVLGVLYTSSQPDEFVATADVALPEIPGGPQSAAGALADVQTEVQVVASELVAAEVAQRLEEEQSPQSLLARLKVSAVGEARVLAISFRAGDAETSRLGAQSFAEAYVAVKEAAAEADIAEQVGGLDAQIDSLRRELVAAEDDPSNQETLNRLISDLTAQRATVATTTVNGGEIITAAQLPQSPAGPGLARNLVIAIAVGLALGLGAAFVRDRLDDEVREGTDIEHTLGVPSLGAVPSFPERFRQPKAALVTVHNPSGPQADAFRRLRSSLLVAKGPSKVVAITSANLGEGKSTISGNLAVALSQAGYSVALVAADIRRPNLDLLFDLPNAPGLSEVLAGTVSLERAMHLMGAPALGVITAGNADGVVPTDLLQSSAMKGLLERLQRRFDIVLIDTPPVLAVADTVALAPMTDAILFVVSMADTSEHEVADALAQLDQAGAEVIGAVVNRSSAGSQRYDAYYPGVAGQAR